MLNMFQFPVVTAFSFSYILVQGSGKTWSSCSHVSDPSLPVSVPPPVDVDQDLDQDSQEYLEALAQATAELECCVNLCKSRVMMETCFDIAVMTAAPTTQGGQQEVEV